VVNSLAAPRIEGTTKVLSHLLVSGAMSGTPWLAECSSCGSTSTSRWTTTMVPLIATVQDAAYPFADVQPERYPGMCAVIAEESGERVI